MGEIAGRLQAVIAESGAERIVHAHYTGTCSLIAGDFPMRFFNRLGATEVDPDSICNKAGHVALEYVYGTSLDGFDPKTARDSRCLVVWGANPSATAPHFHKHWLKESGASVVVVDPVRHETAEAADIHMQPYPGSDAALAFALMHVIWRDGLLDQAFVDAHTIGWPELEPLVVGATPSWAQQVTGVDAATIEDVARLYAAGPSLLWLGQGLQRQPQGGNVMRACAALPAITGNIGKPGAGIFYLNGSGPRNIDGDYVSGPELRGGEPTVVSHMDLADVLADASRSSAFFCWNMNVAASAPRQRALCNALSRDDLFTVVVELFQTDTCDYADIVLPAASFLEFDDLVLPYFSLHVSAQAKVQDAPGQALPNQAIFRRLAKEMGFCDPALYESDEQIIAHLLETSGLGVDFATLKQLGTFDPWDEPIVRYADRLFPTPSGRIELASQQAVADGYPLVPHPTVDPRPGGGTLRLLSPAGKWQMNDSYGNDAGIQRVLGHPVVYLHPADMTTLDLCEGDDVELCNESGALRMQVCASDAIPEGVALCHKGRWAKFDANRGNVNVLNPGQKSDLGESSSVHGTLVRVARVS
jgi:anaerobic selenocysteine-containing dehydrogenase